MEPQIKTWREVYYNKVVDYLEANNFYNRNCQFPETITLPITWKGCMCELGGMAGQFGTVLLISTPTGGYPVGMTLFGIKANEVQATVKVYENSYVGISTRHHDYIHVAIYRVSNLFPDQEFVKDEFGFQFGKVELNLCYSSTEKVDTKTNDKDFILSKNPNLLLLKNALIDKIYNRNCRVPYYIEPLVKLNPEKNADIFEAINRAVDKVKPLDIEPEVGFSSYEYKHLSKFHYDLINILNETRRKHKYVFCRMCTYQDDEDIKSLAYVYYNDNGHEEDLSVVSTVLVYEHTTECTDMDKLNVNAYLKHFTRSYYTTLFGFKNHEDLVSYFEDDENKDNYVNVYSKYSLTTKQF